MSGEIELPGLDGTNPLGYLAALGVLRILSGVAGADASRMRWDAANWRPVVSVPGVGSADQLVEVVWSGVRRGTKSGAAETAAAKRNLDEMRTRVKQKREEINRRRLGRPERQAAIDAELQPLQKQTEWLRQSWGKRLAETAPDPAVSLGADLTERDATFRIFAARGAAASTSTARAWADFCAAFGCEYGTNDPRAPMRATPLALVNGSSHQHFLGSVHELMLKCTVDHVRSALLEPWTYADPGYSLRLDPGEDRRYALMAKDPTGAGNKPRTVWGANRLAFEALPLFPCVAILPRPRTLCVREDGDGTFFYWPLWRPSLTLDEVRSLLSLSEVAGGDLGDSRQLRARGVLAVYRSKRVQVGSGAGRLFNLTPAVPVWC